MNDFLWDSPVYQEIISEAKAKGAETEKIRSLSQVSQVFLQRINDRFPTLKELAQKCVAQIGDNSVLFQLGWEVSAAQTEQEAKQALEESLQA